MQLPQKSIGWQSLFSFSNNWQLRAAHIPSGSTRAQNGQDLMASTGWDYWRPKLTENKSMEVMSSSQHMGSLPVPIRLFPRLEPSPLLGCCTKWWSPDKWMTLNQSVALRLWNCHLSLIAPIPASFWDWLRSEMYNYLHQSAWNIGNVILSNQCCQLRWDGLRSCPAPRRNASLTVSRTILHDFNY